MSMDLSKALVETVPQQPDAPPPPARDTVGGPAIRPHDARPFDWDNAVDAAAARLEESWVLPDATGRMLSSGLAGELAATLCAFGMVAAEVEHMVGHMLDHADKPGTGGERTPRKTLE
jgi:hypothetical protein